MREKVVRGTMERVGRDNRTIQSLNAVLGAVPFSHLCDFLLQFLTLCLQIYNTDLGFRRDRQGRATHIGI